MPVLFKMADDKKTEDTPAVVLTELQAAAPQRKTKKYLIIAISGILAAVVILAAILIGMYMFTEAQKEIIKYTLKMSQNTNQDVTSDPNENVVQYHVSSSSQETWIINDFNRDIQSIKITKEGKTNCFLSPLNRTNAMDPAKITGPGTKDVKDALSLTYRTSETPITDTSFLGKTARNMCKGVSVYWLYPQCDQPSTDKISNSTMDRPKTKRQATVDNSPYYIEEYIYHYSSVTGEYYWVPCMTGCCRKKCACSIDYSAYIDSSGIMQCSWITYSCYAIPENPLYDYYVPNSPTGLSC